MIDPSLFSVKRLLECILHTSHGNVNPWWSLVEIIPKYLPKHAKPGDQPICVVKVGENFLRYSKGPAQGHIWDMYGDDYQTPELALMALVRAPTPPNFLHADVLNSAWEARTGKPTPVSDIKAREVVLSKEVTEQVTNLSAAQILANPPKLKTVGLTEQEASALRQPIKPGPTPPQEIDLDGLIDAKGAQYIGSASRQPDGTYICLADVNGCLCQVEVTVTPVSTNPELPGYECTGCSVKPGRSIILCPACLNARAVGVKSEYAQQA